MHNEDIINYAAQYTSGESGILIDLQRETHLKTVYPAMLAGHTQGKFLEMISNITQPKAILEIGTFSGYSAICMAQGLQADGHLHTIERNPEMEEMALKYFKKAGLENKISMHIGEAVNIIPSLKESFDLVYIDGDKKDYPDFYKLVIDRVQKGGLILADNVLWYNKVTDISGKKDKDTEGIQEFNQLVNSDPRVENILLPMFDGIMLIRKTY